MAGQGFAAKDLITFKNFEKQYFDIKPTPERILFINGPSPENPVRITLNEPLAVDELDLLTYAVTGVPSTGGIPDHTHMNMTFLGGPTHTLLVRNDAQNGFPLLLFAPITVHAFDPPLLISTQRTNMQNFQLYFTNPDGTPAQYNTVAVWFACKNRSPLATPHLTN